jgi:sulfoxide reductase heme-binding subunit YedZ
MTGTPLLWYLNRASGLVLLVLLTVTLVLGVLAAGRGTPRWWPRFATAALHANVAGVSVALLAAHVVTAVVDGFVDIDPVDAVVPFRSPYRPLWLGLGTLASTLLLAAVLTAAGRGLLSPTVWRRAHLLVYPAWPLAVLHGLGTGSDTTSLPVLLLTFAALLAVALAAVLRLELLERPPGARLALRLLVLALPVGLGLWLGSADGPLQPGWADRAGGPGPATTGQGLP